MSEWLQWWMEQWWAWVALYTTVGLFAARWAYAQGMEEGPDDENNHKDSTAWAVFMGVAWLPLVIFGVLTAAGGWFFTGAHKKKQLRKQRAAELRVVEERKQDEAREARVELLSYWEDRTLNAATTVEREIARQTLDSLRQGVA